MSANLVRDKCLVIYYSHSNNTKRLARLIKNEVEEKGRVCDYLSLHASFDYNLLDIESYQLVFVGSPTYGTSKTSKSPKPVLDFLRHILKDNEYKLPLFSVFGTGDTQWGEERYCRSVDEICYHLSKSTTVVNKLKNEQSPMSKHQINRMKEFVDISLGRL